MSFICMSCEVLLLPVQTLADELTLKIVPITQDPSAPGAGTWPRTSLCDGARNSSGPLTQEAWPYHPPSVPRLSCAERFNTVIYET